MFLSGRRFKLIGSAWLSALLLAFGNSLNAGEIEKWDLSPRKTFAKITLRGYGNVSGTVWESPDGTVLEILCDNEEKAKLTESKYLSDVQLLPKSDLSEVSLKEGKVALVRIEDQGVITVLRYGNQVLIPSAPDAEALQRLVSACVRRYGAHFVSAREVEVPMWLDRWDRFGFRFYYRPWSLPKGMSLSNYNVFGEFNFAEQSDRSGFVFWVVPDGLDTSEGMTKNLYWNWALKAATEGKLPIGLNLTFSRATWFTNRYRDQMAAKAPQFSGNYHRIADYSLGGGGFTSWSATTAKGPELGELQQILKELSRNPNVTTILEPHGELRHGKFDVLMEYGPVADASYRDYLRRKYVSLNALQSAWGVDVRSWDEVNTPELADFLGWGKQAIDLSGDWRVGYESYAEGVNPNSKELRHNLRDRTIPTTPPPEAWFTEKYDDSQWPIVSAPGSDRTMFLPQRPAVYRQTINVPQAWIAKNQRVWLYVWDLNEDSGSPVKVFLNGKLVGNSVTQLAVPHWGAYEVTGVLRAGPNQLSLRLPKGILAYRVYLSPDAPDQYPNLAGKRNAEWVDFSDWTTWSRVSTARDGMKMIRQVNPNAQIDLMAPEAYADGILTNAVDFGGNFKNTGYMGVFYADLLPSYMRGARFPFSLEPGEPARDLQDFKMQMGLYATEGIQAIDYFIHVGSVLWNPEIKEYFEEILPMVKLIGKCHPPAAEVAGLYSTRNAELTGYPWVQSFNTNLGGGYWNWNPRAFLQGLFESDALAESSFERGDAGRYKVIIDSNTSIMDEAMVSQIEKYVREGGTFVTYVQTGRHTPTKKDAWPISKLTGFAATAIDPLDENGNAAMSRLLTPVAGETAFSGDWMNVRANGLSLEKVSPDARSLLMWQDGTTAIGFRQIGKGYIVVIGCKFYGKSSPSRVEGKPGKQESATTAMLSQILHWRGIEPSKVRLAYQDANVLWRHYVSNNGLYDIWTVWDRSSKQPIENHLVLPGKISWAWDVQAQTSIPVSQGRIPFKLDPLAYRVFLTPRNEITKAPVEWFELQRDWWRGTADPSSPSFAEPAAKNSYDLSQDWSFRPIGKGEDVSSLAQPGVDDSSWEKMELGIWTTDHRDVRHAILRKTFIVPKEWTSGTPGLWMKGWDGRDFIDKGRTWLDGQLVADWGSNTGLADAKPFGSLKAGTAHTLAVEIQGEGCLTGSQANAWLWYWPKPIQTLNLAGSWSPSDDGLFFKTPVQLPGEHSAMMFRRQVTIPSDLANTNVVVNIEAEHGILGVIVNGRWVRRHHHLIGDHFQLNMTPWIQFGEENEIVLVNLLQDHPTQAPTRVNVKAVELEFHRPDVYP